MSDLTGIERLTIEKLFGMSSGYVLDFSNRTFREFIADSVQCDIEDLKYDYESGSKANQLRAFWKIESNVIVGKLLNDLFAYAEHVSEESFDSNLLNECRGIAARLLGNVDMDESEPLIFVSYARPDTDGVKAVVHLLTKAGFRTWFDKKDLKGGQDWEYEIRKRIGDASLVLICLSTNAVDRKGFFHREMRYAVEEALELPKGKVYIVPVRLNACEIPDDLRSKHALDLFEPDASWKLLESIGDALECGARVTGETHEAFTAAMREFQVD